MENLFPTFQHLNKKQFKFKFYVELEINAPKQYACFLETVFFETKKKQTNYF